MKNRILDEIFFNILFSSLCSLKKSANNMHFLNHQISKFQIPDHQSNMHYLSAFRFQITLQNYSTTNDHKKISADMREIADRWPQVAKIAIKIFKLNVFLRSWKEGIIRILRKMENLWNNHEISHFCSNIYKI